MLSGSCFSAQSGSSLGASRHKTVFPSCHSAQKSFKQLVFGTNEFSPVIIQLWLPFLESGPLSPRLARCSLNGWKAQERRHLRAQGCPGQEGEKGCSSYFSWRYQEGRALEIVRWMDDFWPVIKTLCVYIYIYVCVYTSSSNHFPTSQKREFRTASS